MPISDAQIVELANSVEALARVVQKYHPNEGTAVYRQALKASADVTAVLTSENKANAAENVISAAKK